MHYILTAICAAAMLSAPFAWAGTIYKCKSPQGALLYQEKPCAEEEKSVSSWAVTSEQKISDDAEGATAGSALVLSQGKGGHYFVDGAVNNHYLNFVIDTGASLVALPLALASSAGVRCHSQGAMQTANGITMVCKATIRKFRFGSFTLNDVEAVVVPNLGQPLLGMNVLKRFRVEQDNGVMRLSKKY